MRLHITVLTVIVLTAGAVAALSPLIAGSDEAREIVVVTRQMSFRVGGGGVSNPTIRVSPGERIRITLVNEDAGFDHDFAIAAWGFSTPLVHDKGRTSLRLSAPDHLGRTDYMCSMHGSMMRGTIEVVRFGSSAEPER